ncbi:hypothetical protein N182_35945 [Sinorhizobium sp. GL2]|nr:hypothetical protein N182_35945 [Sinorhizobium sp. GL2]
MSILTIALLAGCQTADEAITTNTDPTAVTGPAASAIAGDMASRFAEQIGAATTTTIRLDESKTEYALALEAAFKGWGYTVVSQDAAAKAGRPVELTYSIDHLDGQILARLTAPSIALARAYTPTANGATPASPLSIMRRN